MVFGCEPFHQFVYMVEELKSTQTISVYFAKVSRQCFSKITDSCWDCRSMTMSWICSGTYGKGIVHSRYAELCIHDRSRENVWGWRSWIACQHGDQLSVLDTKLQEIINATTDDEELKTVKALCLDGLSEERSDIPIITRPYWNFSDVLCTVGELVMKGDKVVIPECKRK